MRKTILYSIGAWWALLASVGLLIYALWTLALWPKSWLERDGMTAMILLSLWVPAMVAALPLVLLPARWSWRAGSRRVGKYAFWLGSVSWLLLLLASASYFIVEMQ